MKMDCNLVVGLFLFTAIDSANMFELAQWQAALVQLPAGSGEKRGMFNKHCCEWCNNFIAKVYTFKLYL